LAVIKAGTDSAGDSQAWCFV